MHKFAKELMGVVACILAVYGGSTMGLGKGGWGHGGPDFSWPAILIVPAIGLVAAVIGAVAFGALWWVAPLIFSSLALFSLMGAALMAASGNWFGVMVVGPVIGLPFLEGYLAYRCCLWWHS